MDTDQWAQLVGVVVSVGSMIYYGVFGHWVHRWECVHDPKRYGQARFYQCRVCSGRRVLNASNRERAEAWVSYRWDRPWEPWELGPPQTPFPKLGGMDDMAKAWMIEKDIRLRTIPSHRNQQEVIP